MTAAWKLEIVNLLVLLRLRVARLGLVVEHVWEKKGWNSQDEEDQPVLKIDGQEDSHFYSKAQTSSRYQQILL